MSEYKPSEEPVASDILQAAVDEHAIMAITDAHGELVYVNDKFTQISRYSREELIGRDYRIIDSDRHSKEFIQELWHTIRHGHVWRGEIMSQAKDGAVFRVDTTIVPLVNGRKEPWRYVAVGTDITARKRAIEAPAEPSSRLSWGGRKGVVIEISAIALAGLAFYFFAREMAWPGVVSKLLFQSNPERMDEVMFSAMFVVVALAAFAMRRWGESEVEIRRRHQSEAALRAMHDELDSRVRKRTAELGAVNDTLRKEIVERKAAEEQLRFHAAVLRETGEIAKVGGWHFDPVGGKGFWTEEVARIHELSPDEAISVEKGISFYHEESQARIEAAVKAAITEAKPYDLELEITTAKGQRKWIRTIGHPVSENGKVVLVRGSFQDITERKKMELELRESEERFSMAFRFSPVAIVLSRRADRRIIEVNDSFLRLFACNHDEMVGHTMSELGLLDAGTLSSLVQQSETTGEVRDREIVARTRAGVLRTISISIRLIRVKGEACALSTLSDITDRRRAEIALRESEARLRTVTDTAQVGMVLVDEAHRYSYANRAYASILNLPSNDIVGLRVEEVLPSVYPTQIKPRLEQAFRGERVAYELAVPGIGPGGETRVFAVAYEPHLEEADKCVVVVLVDITERRQAHELLRASEERFRQVVESIREVFWMMDIDSGELLYVSPGFAEIWGRPMQSQQQISRAWRDSLHPDDADRVRAALTRVDSGDYDESYRIVRPDGAVRWVRDRAFPAKEGRSATRRVVGVAEDITERKRLEQQFLRAQRMEAIGTLSSGITHDLNNILAPMLLVGPVLRGTLSDARDLEMLDIIERSATRGAKIIQQLLTFSRGIEGARALVQPRHLLREIVSIMRETFPREIAIRDDIAGGTWVVPADATQLHQVLINLCVNARDAMPTGGTLTLSAANVVVSEGQAAQHPHAKPGAHVLLAVADTGQGISPENMDRIFEPFFTTKTLGKGTGLGLSTVLGIVKSHGGFVTVYSEPGRGSVFRIYLPADPEGQETSPKAAEDWPRGHGELILVVDDEESIRVGLQRILERSNYRVLCAMNGIEAMEQFVNHPEVRLVLTDLMMPEMDGLALVRALRRLRPELRFIAASGLNDSNRREALSELGVTEVLMKPCEPVEVLAAIARELGHNLA